MAVECVSFTRPICFSAEWLGTKEPKWCKVVVDGSEFKVQWLRKVLVWFAIICWPFPFQKCIFKYIFSIYFYMQNYGSNSDRKQVYNWGVQNHYSHFSKERQVWSNLFGTFLVCKPTLKKKHTFDPRDMFYEPCLRVRTCHLVCMSKWLVGFGCSK